jgi:cytochrome d ubiquinol oxidase subunit I
LESGGWVRAATRSPRSRCSGSWLSGYFIVATNAFLQHPVGYTTATDGTLQLESFSAFVLNPWALVQYAHTMMGAVVTGSFAMAAVGAYWTLRGQHREVAELCLATGVTAGLIGSVLVAFPTGDRQGKLVADYQPITLAAMEGRFESGTHAEIVLIGQPNVDDQRLDNPVRIPGVLSFLAYGTFSSHVRGLKEFPRNEWPTNIELLYYSFHIMAGLGSLFMLLMGIAAFFAWRRTLTRVRPLLWILMLAFPFPFIANSAGWLVTELGRQPWLVHGLLRTQDGSSPSVHAGSALFTLIGFAGLYFVLGLLYLFLVGREVVHGPRSAAAHV